MHDMQGDLLNSSGSIIRNNEGKETNTTRTCFLFFLFFFILWEQHDESTGQQSVGLVHIHTAKYTALHGVKTQP